MKRPKNTTFAPCLMNKYWPSFDAAICDAEIASAADEEPKPKLAPEVEADVVADDCAGDRGGNDGCDAFAPMTRVHRRHDQNRLAWQGDAHAFQTDHEGERPIAVFAQEVVKAMHWRLTPSGTVERSLLRLGR